MQDRTMRCKVRGPLPCELEKTIHDLLYRLFTRNLIIEVVHPNRACDLHQRLKSGVLIKAFQFAIMLVSGIEEPSHSIATQIL